jgi:hypothetical protein
MSGGQTSEQSMITDFVRKRNWFRH